MWKSSLVSIVVLMVSVASAHAWSEQNCIAKCRLTASSGKAEACIARTNCAKYRGRTHDSNEKVRKSAARWKERNYLVGSIYEGKAAGGRTYRNRRGFCPARRHSAGVC